MEASNEYFIFGWLIGGTAKHNKVGQSFKDFPVIDYRNAFYYDIHANNCRKTNAKNS